ncbi:MAG: UvrD-helicase domain-containing protein [Clostridiales bacterium]|nr:UvrD-helicase domain-containing protein [Clostridiales bacterium]
MSFLEDDEDIIFQTKKTKEILEMIEYVTNKFYEKFEKAKIEENLLDYIDLEKYTLKLLYDKKEDLSKEVSKENTIIKIEEKCGNLDNLRESIKIEYDIAKLEEIYNEIFGIIQERFLNYTELLNNKYVLSDIAKAMKEDVEEIAVDEYQDINMLQEYIIRAVSNKNIFRVGDPKQSIYGFRNSRPELFVEKENNIDNENKVIYLDKNFRSLENVLEITNNVFSRIMTKETGIIDYNENHYLKKGRYITGEFRLQENSDISSLDNLEISSLSEEEIQDRINFFKPEILLINTKEEEESDDVEGIDDNKEENKNEQKKENALEESEDINDETLEEIESIEKEAIAIAKRIIALKEEYIRRGKKLDYKDIVILLRSVNNKAGRYQEILEKFGIPCYTDVNESFLEIPEVSLICSYLDIIENPLNDMNMLAVLRSYFFKMDIDEFTRIKVVEKEITNGQKENNFYESILIYIDYIDEKAKENIQISLKEKMVYSKCKKLIEELTRLKKLEEEKGLYEVLKDIIIESRILYST